MFESIQTAPPSSPPIKNSPAQRTSSIKTVDVKRIVSTPGSDPSSPHIPVSSIKVEEEIKKYETNFETQNTPIKEQITCSASIKVTAEIKKFEMEATTTSTESTPLKEPLLRESPSVKVTEEIKKYEAVAGEGEKNPLMAKNSWKGLKKNRRKNKIRILLLR
jgi:hypothetical protein